MRFIETLESRRMLSTNLTLVREFVPAGALGEFGFSVALDGNRAVVSSYTGVCDYFDNWSVGSAHLFDASSGKQLQKLEGNGGTGNRYGRVVAVSGNRALVASKWGIYGFDTATGKQVFNLKGSEVAEENFGSAVAIDENTILQGGGVHMSPYDEPGPRGSARLFNATTGQELVNFTPEDLSEGFGYGCSVAISGNYALIGTSGNGAYLFDVTSKKLARKFQPPAGDYPWLGSEVAMDGNLALIVGNLADHESGFSSGTYVFDVTTGKQVTTLIPIPDDNIRDYGLGSVAVSGNYAMVGYRQTAYLFNATTGRQIGSLHSINQFAIDGNRILAAGEGRAYLYKISEGDTASLSGSVFDDTDRDGLKDTCETGISGRTLYADLDNDKKPDASEPTAVTNSVGKYTIRNLAAGSYNVRQVLPAGWTQSAPRNNYGFKVTLAEGQQFSGAFHGSYLNLGSISGSVFNDLDRDGRRDTGEAGLAGRTLFIDLDDDREKDSDEPSAITNANGWYTIKNLPKGYYNVRQILPAGWHQSTPANGYGFKVNLLAGQNIYSVKHGAYQRPTPAGR